jgi:hypothetical protein
MSEKNLYYLNELSNYKVASDYPDVRGWEIKDGSNRTIGKVDNLLVNKKAKRVVYLDVEVDDTIINEGHEELQSRAIDGVHEFTNKEGENHLIVPIGLVDVDEENQHVISNDINYDTFRNTKRFGEGSLIEPDYEITVYQQYIPGNPGNSLTVDDDFYNQKAFQSRYKGNESL